MSCNCLYLTRPTDRHTHCPCRDVLGVEYLTSDMDGAGHDLKVGKGSSADKSRSNYRKQDRRFRSANTDFVGGDFGDFDD
jgi:hypothetical protein